MPEYSLNELASLADVTPRTIRFYIEQGLLPEPTSLGPKARYTDEHLARLLAIKKLQSAHLPLAEIRQQLRTLPAEQVTRVAEATAPTIPAIDYIRGVLGTPVAPARAAQSVPSPTAPAPLPTGPQPEPVTSRSQWERVSLDPDVELHVRRPLTRQNTKRVERLITIARQLFEED